MAHLLLVEGVDDQIFFSALLRHLKIKTHDPSDVDTVLVQQLKSKENFTFEKISFKVKEPHFDSSSMKYRSLGLICDADQDPSGAFDKLSNVLKKLSFPLPTKKHRIATTSDFRTGIFVMPDQKSLGALEDLCLQSIQQHPVYPCIEKFIECSRPFVEQFISEKHSNLQNAPLQFQESKARVQAFLATQIKITDSTGIAAQKSHWDFDHECFSPVKQFLTDLFVW